MPKKSSKPIRDFETEWISVKPGHHNTKRFERILSGNDTRQKNQLQNISMPEEIPPTNLATIYAVKNKQWKIVGHKCIDCGKPMNDPEVLKKHSLLCTNEKEINKQEEQQILSRVPRRNNNANTEVD